MVMIIDILHNRLCFDKELALDCGGLLTKLKLRGVIYGGQGHFVARFIDLNGAVWFHDGISTGRLCVSMRETDLASLPDNMAQG
ncbi:hypothetical protein FB451DRAFT_1238638 [Mycena latifolia]|nr:hypothetical protein FB451DRAFT_1238638 [Mycena latifolia]